MIGRFILTAIGVIILAAAVIWIFKQCWHDMAALLNELDEFDKPDEIEDEKEKAG